MNRYNCLIILPEGTKDVTILSDSMVTHSTCCTSFNQVKEIVTQFGQKGVKWDLVAQYPTDRLIIESVEYDIDELQ